MKFAKAMKMGGLLVEAKNVDYEDYYGLGLVCPECNEVVFRNSGGQRVLSSGKTFIVEPFFSHHKAINSVQAQECEKRVKQYDQAEIERINSQVRGQWLSLLHKYFWRTYSKSWVDNHNFLKRYKVVYANRFNVISVLRSNINDPAAYLEAELNFLVTRFRELEAQNSYLEILETAFIKYKHHATFMVNDSDNIQINNHLGLLGQDNSKRYLQALIFKEILLFLTAPNNRLLLTAMYVGEWMMSWNEQIEIDGEISEQALEQEIYKFFARTSDEEIRLICLGNIMVKLYAIPWLNEFEKYQQSPNNKRAKPVGFGQINSRQKKRNKSKFSKSLV